ncbi:MAG: hypothetical protein K6A14_08570 [Erysipelotrichaceae bacterium]|nr:hypothetical protein [Erysipelotrichaceae bacterium]
MHRTLKLILCLLIVISLAACHSSNSANNDSPAPLPDSGSDSEIENRTGENNMNKNLHLSIDNREVPVTWETNRSVTALQQLASEKDIAVKMSRYGGFEQVGSLGSRLVSDDVQTSTSYGDIVLYSSDQIVIFFGSNSWSYTRLGHVDLSEGEMRELLDHDSVTAVISVH